MNDLSNLKFFIPKGKNFQRGEVLTTPEKKPSSVLVSPVPVQRKSDSDNSVSVSNDKKTPIKGLFIGAKKDIPVYSFYVDSYGDLVMHGILTRTRKIIYDTPVGHPEEFKLIHESYQVSETVCSGEFTISNQQYIKKELIANSGTVIITEPMYVETVTDTDIEENDNTVTRTRTVHKALTGDILTLCSLTYGDGRKVREHETSKGIVEYVAQNKPKEGGGFIYEGILTCAKENEALAISIIKNIVKEWKKSTICWE